MARKLPGDTKQRNAVILAIQRAIEHSFSATDWKDLGYRTGTQEWIKNHPRLLRSLSWGDGDYGGHVLDAIEKILETDPSNLDELLNTPAINEWLLKNDAAALGYRFNPPCDSQVPAPSVSGLVRSTAPTPPRPGEQTKGCHSVPLRRTSDSLQPANRCDRQIRRISAATDVEQVRLTSSDRRDAPGLRPMAHANGAVSS
jgi:hypothetical protein